MALPRLRIKRFLKKAARNVALSTFILLFVFSPLVPFVSIPKAQAIPAGLLVTVYREGDAMALDAFDVSVRCAGGSWQSVDGFVYGGGKYISTSNISTSLTNSNESCADGDNVDIEAGSDGYVTREIDSVFTAYFGDTSYSPISFSDSNALLFSHKLSLTDHDTSAPISGLSIDATNAGGVTCISGIDAGTYLCPVPLASDDSGATVSFSGGGYDSGMITLLDRTASTDAQAVDNGSSTVTGGGGGGGPTITAPGSPTDLSNTGHSDSSMSLSWSAPLDNGGADLTDYIVEYSPHNENPADDSWTTFDDGVTASITTADVTGLTASTSYDFRVSATNGTHTSDPSTIYTYSTDAVPPTSVSSCADFESIASNLSASYIMTKDLTCNGEGSSIMVGSADHPFTGTFNGGGYKMSYSVSGVDADNIGLFRNTDHANISNIWVAGSVDSHSHNNIGGLVGSDSGSYIYQIKSSVNFTGDSANTGGVVGSASGTTVEDAFYTGSISMWNVAGGIIGSSYGSIVRRAYDSGSVTGSANYIGGIVGSSNGSTIVDTFSVAPISAGGSYFGGIVGSAISGTISDNAWDSHTSGQTDCIGGTPGSGSIAGCAAVDTDGNSPNYFKNNTSVAPFPGADTNPAWDFSSVWSTTSGYPEIIHLMASPSVVIMSPTASSTVKIWNSSVAWDTSATCEYNYDGGGWNTLADCSGHGLDIPAPSGDGSHTLNIRGTSSHSKSATASVAFTYSTPTNISSCADFEAINSGLSGNYKLTTDLNCIGEHNAMMIGLMGDGSSVPFTGAFDGNGHTIKINMSFSDRSDYGKQSGLFINMDSGAMVANLKVAGDITSNGGDVGGIVGILSNGTIYNSVSAVNVTAAYESGGFAGFVNGSSSYIHDSYSTGNVHVSGNIAGGFVGMTQFSAVIDRSYSTGNVTEDSGAVAGGFAGYIQAAGLVKNSWSAGVVTGGGSGINGGFAGYAADGMYTDLLNDYYDSTRSGKSGCADGTDAADGYCAAYNIGSADSTHFFGTSANAPMTNLDSSMDWDFASIWETVDGAYPALRVIRGDEIAHTFSAGDGASDSTAYSITSCAQLQYINEHLSSHFILQSDLTCTNPTDYFPLARQMSGNDMDSSFAGFSGVFNGNNHSLTFAINVEPGPSNITNDLGLFGYVHGGTVENLTLHVNTGTITGGNLIGGVAGKSNDVVYASDTPSYFTNIVSDINVGGYQYLGGIVGEGTNTFFKGVSSSGNIASETLDAGGIVGSFYGNDNVVSVASANRTHYIESSFSTGTISGSHYIGGLAGYFTRGEIANSYANGTITENGSLQGYTGGLVGDLEYGTIDRSYFGGSILSSTTTSVGGLVGMAFYGGFATHDLISNSFSSGTRENDASGIVGVNDSNVTDFTNDYFDLSSGGEGACYDEGSPSVDGCTGVSPSDESTYWKDTGNEPMAHFNTNTVWTMTSGTNYPQLLPYINTFGAMKIKITNNGSTPLADARVEVNCPSNGHWFTLGTTNSSGIIYSNISQISGAGCDSGVGNGDGAKFRAYLLHYQPKVSLFSAAYYTDIDSENSDTFHDGSNNYQEIALDDAVAFAGAGGGSGTEGDPYIIQACSDFPEINKDLGAYYRFDASIYGGSVGCNGEEFPLARVMSDSDLDPDFTGFFGTLDGHYDHGDGTAGDSSVSFNVVHISASDKTDFLGLFGFVNGGTIKNIHIGLQSDPLIGGSYLALVAGAAQNATFINVNSSSNVKYGGTTLTNGIYGQDLSGNSISSSSFTGTYTRAFSPVAFDGGDGLSKDTAYLISTCNQLESIGQDDPHLSAYYKLTTNIDCSATNISDPGAGGYDAGMYNGGLGFKPIGPVFYGTLDGDNGSGGSYKIDNLNINRPGDNYVGIFSAISGGTVKNIKISGGAIAGNLGTGNLAGEVTGSTFDNITTGTNQSIIGGQDTGGLVGYMEMSNISNSTYAGTVNGGLYTGGLVGYFSGDIDGHTNNTYSITGSTTNVAVTGNDGAAGGLVGRFEYGAIDHGSVTSGDPSVVTDVDGSNIGGLVGLANTAIVTNSNANTNISSSSNVGGLVGNMYQTSISNSNASGSIFAGTSDQRTASAVYIGGAVGYNVDSGVLDHVFSTSNVNVYGYALSGSSANFYSIGGLFGVLCDDGQNCAVNNSYSTGNVTIDTYSSDNSYLNVFSIGGFGGNIYGGQSSGPVTSEKNYSTGTVTVTGGSTSESIQTVGGFIGNISSADFEQSYSSSPLNITLQDGATATYLGGFAGDLNSSTLVNDFSSGDISVTMADSGIQDVGGFSGLLYFNNISNSYTSSTISATSSNNGSYSNIGGFAGYMGGTESIANSFNARSVSLVGMSGDHVGGFVGNYDVGDSYASLTGDYYYETPDSFSQYCDGSGTDISIVDGDTPRCVGLGSGENPVSYFYNQNNPPMTSNWTFGSIWAAHTAHFPSLQPLPNPYPADPITYGGGDGSSGTPYQISTCLQLQGIGQNPEHLAASYQLTQNIDCSATTISDIANPSYESRLYNGGAGFDPIGDYDASAPFTGTLNGDNGAGGVYSITGLNIYRPTNSYTGLFSYTQGALIENLAIVGGVTGANYTGGIVGYDKTTPINNVSFTGDVSANTSAEVGGFVGGLESYGSDITLSNDTYNGTVNGGNSDAGGFAGYTYSENSNITFANDNTIGTVNGSEYVGGYVGYVANYNQRGEEVHINDSTSTITVNGTRDSVGGLIGYMGDVGQSMSDDTTMVEINNSNHLSRTVTGAGSVGGLIGGIDAESTANISIINSYATGGVVSSGDSVGGLVGLFLVGGDTDAVVATVTGSHFDGTISGGNNSNVGGLIGSLAMDSYSNSFASTVNISNNYSTGEVDGGNSTGGLVGNIIITGESSTSYGSNFSLSQNYSTANVVNASGYSTGGLVGGYAVYNSNSQPITTVFDKNYSTGTISGYGDVGGLFGDIYTQDYTGDDEISTTIQKSYFAGASVTDTVDGGAGGIAAYTAAVSGYPLYINDSYAQTTITGRQGVGGIVGATIGTSFNRVYASGKIIGTDIRNAVNAGGLVGTAGAGTYIGDSFADNTISNFSENFGGISGTTGQETLSNDYYDQYFAGQSTNCDPNTGGIVGCSAIDTDGLSPEFFKGNMADGPLSEFSFYNADTSPSGTWDTADHFLPTLHGVTATFGTPHIAFVSPTPDDSSSVGGTNFEIKTATNDEFGGHYAFTNLDNSLKGYWQFENNANDSSGNGQNGSVNGAAVDTVGKFGHAYLYNGTDGYINVPNSDQLNVGSGDFTVSFWMKPNVWGDDAQSYGVLSKIDESNNGYVVYNDTNYPTKINIRFPGQDYFPSNSDVQTGVWQLWTFVRHGSTGTWYLNGAVDKSDTVSTSSLVSAADLQIGRSQPWNGFFNGAIDDTMIFDRGLSDTEVSSLYDGIANQYDNTFTDNAGGAHSFSSYSVDTHGVLLGTSARSISVAGNGFAGGDGSSGTPYQISSCQGLQNMNQNLSANYVLTGEVDCSDFDFAPVGNNDTPFTGTLSGAYDGGVYDITNLTITSHNTDDYVGLFGAVDGSNVEGSSIHDFNIGGISITGHNYVGLLAGKITNASIQNIGSSRFTSPLTGNDYVGGLVGQSVNSSFNTITFNGSVYGESYVGGVVGDFEGDPSNVNSFGISNVSAGISIGTLGTGSAIGGIVGYLANGIVAGAYVSGEGPAVIDGSSGAVQMGGIAGYAENTTISNSYASDTITGYREVGGLVGELEDTNLGQTSLIIYSQSSGTVNGGTELSPVTGADYVAMGFGGLLGYNIGQGQIILSSSSSDVNVFTSDYEAYGIGGLAGAICDDGNNCQIGSSSATGDVTVSETAVDTGAWGDVSEIGGLAGYMNGNYSGGGSNQSSEDFATGDVTVNVNSAGRTAQTVAGLIGSMDNLSLDSSYSSGTISVNLSSGDSGSSIVGGFAGWAGSSQISNSFSSSPVSITTNTSNIGQIGGFVGLLFASSVNKSYSSGDITHTVLDGEFLQDAGGFVGNFSPNGSSTIQNSFSTGAMPNESTNSIGGFIGTYNQDDGYASLIDDFYYNVPTTAAAYCVGSDVGQNVNLSSESGALCTGIDSTTVPVSHFYSKLSAPMTNGVDDWGFDSMSGPWSEDNAHFPTLGILSNPYPSDWNAEYWNLGSLNAIDGSNNIIIPGRAADVTTSTNNIDYEWGTSTAPISGIGHNNFISRYTRTVDLDAGNYLFRTSVDDKIEVYLDGTKITESWYYFSNPVFYLKNTYGGTHTITVLYFASGSENNLHFSFVPWNGSGTKTDPYIISSCQALQDMQYNLNATYALSGDIDCSGSRNWNPNPDNGSYYGFIPLGSFHGALNGNGHTINGLYINSNSAYGGLFSDLYGFVYNLNFNGGSISSGNTTGTVAGRSDSGTIIGVTSNVPVFGYNYAGGLVGNGNSVNISQSSFSAMVHSSGIAGGLVGEADGVLSISNSFATGGVTGDSLYAGGLVGDATSNNPFTISNSYSSSNVTGLSLAGGILGYMVNNTSSSSITNTFATGTLSADTTGDIVASTQDSSLAVNNSFYDHADPFQGNTSTAPLDQWDFTYIWSSVDGQDPQLQLPANFVSPGVPVNPTASSTGLNMHITWNAPVDIGNTPIDYYLVEVKPTAGVWAGNSIIFYDSSNQISPSSAIDGLYSFDVSPNLLHLGTAYDVRISAVSYFGQGDYATASATTPDPTVHYISSCSDLQNIDTNPDTFADTFFLVQSIDCTGFNFVPLDVTYGGWTHSFQGVFDGNNNEIDNFTIDGTNFDSPDNLGLFGNLNGATVKKVKFVGGYVIGRYNIGLVAGNTYNGAVVTRVTSNIPVSIGTADGAYGYSLGGLVGNAYDGLTMTNNIVNANVDGSGTIGGLIGEYSTESDFGSNLEFSNNTFSGNVTGNGGDDVGGLIGYLGDYFDLSASGTVNMFNNGASGAVTGNEYSGGLVGYLDIGTYDNSNVNLNIDSNAYSGSVSSDTYSAGGLIGLFSVSSNNTSSYTASVTNNYSHGSVSTVSDNAGGLFGDLEFGTNNSPSETNSISNNYSSSAVSGNNSVGGLVGYTGGNANVSFSNSFAAGLVSSVDVYNAGIFGNLSDPSVYTLGDNWYDSSTTMENECYATGGSISRQDVVSKCEGNEDINAWKNDSATAPLDQWDFNTVWKTNATDYPTLLSTIGSGSTGSGTTEDPYTITSCNDLSVVQSHLGSSFILTRDLDCTSFGNDVIIGDTEGMQSFYGTFDGQGYSIKIAIDEPSIGGSYTFSTGLFSFASNAVIKNLTIAAGSTVNGGLNVGGLVGVAVDSEITNVTSHADVTANLVGDFMGIQLFGTGGVVGTSLGTAIYGSSSDGNINSDLIAGGIVGTIMGYDNISWSSSYVKNSWSSAHIVGDLGLGGIVGYVGTSAVISDDYFTGMISTDNAGGIYGLSGGFGGILGFSAGNVLIQNTYSSGRMDSGVEDLDPSGGIVGSTVSGGTDPSLTINNSWSVMRLRGSSALGGVLGGITDSQVPVLSKDYYDLVATGLGKDYCIGSTGGMGGDTSSVCDNVDSSKTPDYFKNNSSNSPLKFWDFNNTWITHPTQYPTLNTFTGTFTAPSAPSITSGVVSRDGSNGQVALAWTAPTDDGGLPILSYQVQYRVTGSDGDWFNASLTNPTDLSTTISGLTYGDSYDFTVSATNLAGASGVANYSTNVSTSNGIVKVTVTDADSAVMTGATVKVSCDSSSWGTLGVTDENGVVEADPTAVFEGCRYGTNPYFLVSKIGYDTYVTGASDTVFYSDINPDDSSTYHMDGDTVLANNTYTVSGSILKDTSKYTEEFWNLSNPTQQPDFDSLTAGRTPDFAASVDTIQNDWGDGSPASGVNTDGFVGRWTKTLDLSAGTYHFHTRSDDGARVFVDGTQVIFGWYDQGATDYYSDNISLSAGPHTIVVEYYENGGGAVIYFDYHADHDVSSCADLQNMKNDLAGTYNITADFSCAMTNPSSESFDTGGVWSDGKGFEPVGNPSTPFTGTVNGNGHTISDLYINRPDEGNVGLFGYVGSAYISNLNIVNAQVSASSVAGILIGHDDSAGVYSIHTSGSVSTSGDTAGGVIGDTGGDEYTATVSSSATVTGANAVGGVVGTVYGDIEYSHSTGNVNAVSNSGTYFGGFAGIIYGYAGYSFATGTVTAPNGTDVGGFTGYLSGYISNSYATGNVIAENESSSGASSNVGGFAGFSGGSLTNSYATGNVTGATNVGGFAGLIQNSSDSNVYSVGHVTGVTGAGGLFGTDYLGASTITNAFWDADTSGQESSAGGTAKTDAQMKDINIFTKLSTDGWDNAGLVDPVWDFTGNQNDDGGGYDYWAIYPGMNGGYPYMSWQPYIASIDVSGGPTAGGTNVTLTGTAFTEGTAIYFDGISADLLDGNNTSLVVSTPAHAAGTVDILFTNQDGSSFTLANGFTYFDNPTISDVNVTPDSSGAVVSWATDKNTSSHIDYGLISEYNNSDSSPEDFSDTSHSMTLTGLVACSTYHYRVSGADVDGHSSQTDGSIFTTTGCAGDAAVTSQNSAPAPLEDGVTVPLVSDGKGVTLVVPSGYSDTAVEFQVKKLDKTTALTAIKTPSGFVSAGDYVYDMHALITPETYTSTFSKDLSLTINYGTSDVSGLVESSLKIFRYDEGGWTALDNCVVDRSAKTVTCTTNNFSTFSLFATVTPPAPPAPPSGGGGGGGGFIYVPPVVTPTITTPLTTPVTTNTLTDLLKNINYVPQTCAPYITSYMQSGKINTSSDVKKLQTFFNTYEGEKLTVTGVYDKATVAAVNRFQTKHIDVLKFWNLSKPTGYVMVATQKAINREYCEQTKKLACPYFSGYAKQGTTSPEVVKIKTFLNDTQGEKLDLLSSLYDSTLSAAVKRFQLKYKSDVLIPWGISKPSGYWYQSTAKKADEILGCYAPVRLDNGKVLQ